MGYDFQVEYRKGIENQVANELSRKEENAEFATISTLVPRWLDTIKEEVKLIQNYNTLSIFFKKGRLLDHGTSRKEYYFLRIGFILVLILHCFRI